MIVRFVATGKENTFDDSYAMRLIEQGKAIPAQPEPFMNEPETEPQPEEKPKAGKNRKAG